jgi:alpha-2-macroglobulin
MTQDQHQYQPGDIARLNIQTPGSATLLLTVHRQDIQRVFVLNIPSTDPMIFELPVGYEDSPNVYIAGTFVQGMLSPDDSPSYANTSVVLVVQPVHRELNVEIIPSTTEATQGEEVTFSVSVTDSRGFPVRAEVGMALVDEAVLSLAPSASPSLIETFYSNQRNRIVSSISLRGLVDDLTDQLLPLGMGGGGGGDAGGIEASLPRQNYETTPLWLPDVMTDENGNVSVSLIMPDNLTRWRLDVRVVSLSTLVGKQN